MRNLLAGDKVYLRRVERQDLEKRAHWINDPEIQATMNYPNWPVSLQQTVWWFERVTPDLTRRDFSVFTIEGNEYIGIAAFTDIEVPVMKAAMHIMIGEKRYWGGGYGTDTYRVMVNYGFGELGLRRIYGHQLAHAHGAHKIVSKLGWQREGLLRQDIFSHGQIKDRYIVSILYEEWERNPDLYGMAQSMAR